MSSYMGAENREYFQGVIDRATVQIDGYLEQWKLAEEPDRSIWRLYISRAHAEIEHFRQGIDCVDGKISDQIFMFCHANYLLRQKMLLIEIRDFFEPTLRSEQYKIDPDTEIMVGETRTTAGKVNGIQFGSPPLPEEDDIECDNCGMPWNPIRNFALNAEWRPTRMKESGKVYAENHSFQAENSSFVTSCTARF